MVYTAFRLLRDINCLPNGRLLTMGIELNHRHRRSQLAVLRLMVALTVAFGVKHRLYRRRRGADLRDS